MASHKREPHEQTTPDTGGGTAVLDRPPDALAALDESGTSQAPPWLGIDGKAAWASESVVYLFDPETRELRGADVAVWFNDGESKRAYSAQIKRDGGENWAWWEGDTYVGHHQPGIQQLIGRALAKGRGQALQGIVT